jgi:hypothetical protein
MTPRQVEKLMISRANKKTDTKAERQFAIYLDSRLIAHAHDISLRFYDMEALKFYTFQCDFLRYRYAEPMKKVREWVGNYDVDFEVDGKGHKEKNDPWKDALKSADGIKVIHIPEPITAEKHWTYLDKELQKAFDSKEMIHHIAA